MTNLYVTLSLLKSSAYLDISDTDDDQGLLAAIEAASRATERITERRFYATSETRYFTPTDPERVFVGDFLGITMLSTDSSGDRTYATTWTASDYELWPPNAPLDGRPYRAIELHPTGSYTFPVARNAVKLVGSFGFCELEDVPGDIVEAVALAASRMYKRHKATFGVSGTPEYGLMASVVPSLKKDPDYMALVEPFIAASRWTP